MDIVVVLERVYHILVARDVRENSQLNLAVVGINQHIAFPRGKELAHFASELCSDGDILEIRLGGADSACARFGLVEARVNTTVGSDDLQKSVAVGRFELSERSVAEHHIHNGI